MKRVKFPGMADTITVDDPALINALSEDPRIDRVFEYRPLLNRILLKRLVGTLSYGSERFPHLAPRKDAARAARQEELWKVFSERAAGMAEGPEELEELGRWVKGDGPAADPGILVQQVIGSFWSDEFQATAESWAAAVTLNTAARSRNLPKMFWWGVTGKVARAKRLLGVLADNNIVFMHGIGVALHNIVASVRTMRRMYEDEALRRRITPEKAVEHCLAAPPVVFRQASTEGKVGGCPFSKYSMFQFKLRDAYNSTGAKDMVFMSNSWSRCPAEQWAPAVLAGIWRRACK